MSQRFFAPAFEVEINSTKLAADISKNVTSLSVTLEANAMDQCSLTLANPYPQMRWTHSDDADLFQEGNGIKVKLGYVDDLQELFDGEITQISPDFPESGTPTVRIESHTRLHWLQQPRQPHAFENATDKEIVEFIAGEHHLTAEVDDAKTTYPHVIRDGRNDLHFLRERAQLIHFEVAVHGKKLLFRKVKNAQSPVYTLVWGAPHQSVAPGQNVMPLKSFTPTLNTRQQVNEVIVRGQNPTTRETIEGRADRNDDSTMGGSQTGGQVAAQAFGGQRQLLLASMPVATEEEARQKALGYYQKQSLTFVAGSGSSIGLPALRAGQVIRLEGLGPRFSGNYYIRQVTHSISSGGYLTQFSVQRNAVS